MKRSYRRHRNPHTEEKNEQPFFSSTHEKQTPSQSFFTSASVQKKELTVGKPGDKYEQEADAMADAVVNHASGTPAIHKKELSTIQRETLSTPEEDEKLGTAEERMEKDKLIQEKPELQMMGEKEEEEMPVQEMHEEEEPEMQMQEEEEEEAPVQTKGEAGGSVANPSLTHTIRRKAGGGKPLSGKTQTDMESTFGMDFSGVHIHTDDEAVKMNKSLHAQAFTHGKDIYFNAGKYNPDTSAGKHLLAHELTHVVQQGKGSVKRKIQPQLYPPIPIIGPICRPATSGTANPGPGIHISYQGKQVQVRARLQVHGPAASEAVALQMKQTIERLWTGSFPDGYSIETSVSISYRGSGEQVDANATQIRVYNVPGRALGRVTHMWGPGNRTMEYNLAGTDINWSPAHEFGHLLGLEDRYSETTWSFIRGLACPEEFCGRETEPDEGYENNIMGVDGGRLESKNIKDLIGEHQNFVCTPPSGLGGGTPPMA